MLQFRLKEFLKHNIDRHKDIRTRR